MPSALTFPDVQRPNVGLAQLERFGREEPPGSLATLREEQRTEQRTAVGVGSTPSFSFPARFLPVAHAACVALASLTEAGWLSRRPLVGPFLLYSVQTLPRRVQGTSWSC